MLSREFSARSLQPKIFYKLVWGVTLESFVHTETHKFHNEHVICAAYHVDEVIVGSQRFRLWKVFLVIIFRILSSRARMIPQTGVAMRGFKSIGKEP